MSELKKEIHLKGFQSGHRLAATKFLTEFAGYVKQGYVLHPKPATSRQIPSFMGSARCTMVTEAYAAEILKGMERQVEVMPVKSEDIAKPEVVVEPEAVTPEPEVVIADDEPESPLTKLNTLTKKAEMLAFAKEVGIEVPVENVDKGTKSIKQFLINTLSE